MHRTRPADAELFGIDRIVRLVINPVEVNLLIESNEHRFTGKIGTVKVFAGKAVVNSLNSRFRARLRIDPPAFDRLNFRA